MTSGAFNSRSVAIMCALCIYLAACTKPNPYLPGVDAPPTPDDAAVGKDATQDDALADAANECQPGTTVCADDTLKACSDDGTLTTNTCPLGCNDAEPRCNDVDPSNGLAAFLDMTQDGPNLTLPEGTIINTTDGTVTDAEGNPIVVPNSLVSAPTDGVDVRVFVVRSLVLESISVRGDAAIAFVSNGDIEISGTVDVNSGELDLDSDVDPFCRGGSAKCKLISPNQNCSGAGGSGFGTEGGDGGEVVGIVAGGRGGFTSGNENLVPLRGGCSSFGGDAGGAIQLVSRTAIQFVSGGFLDLNGEGASGGSGPGGGGSGGAALLEAPVVIVANSAGITANGGGGGGGCVNGDGANGQLSSMPAPGGECTDGTGSGGDGAAGTTAAGDGVSVQDGEPLDAAGAGGGGAGRIRINVSSNGYQPAVGITISPAPNVGRIAVR